MGNVIPWSQIHPSITSQEPFVAVVIIDPQRQICVSEMVPFDQEALGDADEHPAEGTATMLLQPELLLERVDDRLDPLPHPAQRPEPARLVLAIRPDEAGPQRSDVALERAAGKALVGQDDRAGSQRLLPGGVVEQHLGDLALAQLGVARHQVIGRPSGAVSRYSLKPQYQRLWLRS